MVFIVKAGINGLKIHCSPAPNMIVPVYDWQISVAVGFSLRVNGWAIGVLNPPERLCLFFCIETLGNTFIAFPGGTYLTKFMKKLHLDHPS